MKKAITLRLCIVIVVSMAATAVLSYYIQIKSAREAMETNAELRINQVKEILEKNGAEIEKLKQNLARGLFCSGKSCGLYHTESAGSNR